MMTLVKIVTPRNQLANSPPCQTEDSELEIEHDRDASSDEAIHSGTYPPINDDEAETSRVSEVSSVLRVRA